MYIPDDQEISRGPRETSQGQREISRSEGDVQPNSSRFEAVYGHSLIINPSLGMYQEIHPCNASSIDSIKINTSLVMMKECEILPLRPRDFLRPKRFPEGNPSNPPTSSPTLAPALISIYHVQGTHLPPGNLGGKIRWHLSPFWFALPK